jgi:hypothetical protein
MGTTLRNAINHAKKIAEQTGETVLIIQDKEYQEVYGLDLSFYPVRESRFDGCDQDQKIITAVNK